MAELKVRDSRLDFAKGIGIFLVVLGHFAPSAPPNSNWWQLCVSYIYSFHMPCFLFLSGFIASKYYRPIQSKKLCINYIKNKLVRFMLPHFIFAVVIFALKLLFGELSSDQLDIKYFCLIYTDPMRSHAQFLWFVYLLFLFSLLTPWFLSLSHDGQYCLIFVALVCYSLSIVYPARPPAFSLLLTITQFFPFYLFGIFCFSNNQRSNKKINILVVFVFIVFSYFHFVSKNDFWLILIIKNSICWSAICITYNILNMSTFKFSFLSKFFSFLGEYSYPIYLMNTTILGGVVVILLKCGIGWTASMLSVHMIVGCVFALGLPIFIQRFVIERTPVIRSIFRR